MPASPGSYLWRKYFSSQIKIDGKDRRLTHGTFPDIFWQKK